MKLMVRPYDKESEKHLLRVLAEVALEAGREGDGRCNAVDDVRDGKCADTVRETDEDTYRKGGLR